ncbi:MAG: sensor histidine kinase [Bellilinea sp.]|nr:sensor histidine kinase [Bellilinea sp.]
MNKSLKPVDISTLIILLAGFVVVLGLELILKDQPSGWTFWLPAVLLAGAISWLFADWWLRRKRQKTLEISLRETRKAGGDLERRLNGMLRLNQIWLEAQTEKELIERSLTIFSEMTGAVGVSFMPFDEWGQPLNALTQGAYPAPVLKAWAEHLSEPRVRSRCRVCQKLETTVGESCPLLEAPFDQSVRIYCLPLQRETQTLAMLNIYLPPDRQLDGEMHEFLTTLLREMLSALEGIRLKVQEQAALRQSHSPQEWQSSVEHYAQNLLDRLCAIFDFSAARLEIKPSLPHFTGLRLMVGREEWLNSQAADDLMRERLNELRPADCSLNEVCIIEDMLVLALPCCLPGGVLIGMVLFVTRSRQPIPSMSRELLTILASQLAMLVESERLQQEREYRVVLQERIRLAREIHDSLAQTLAYLKLTVAQMQTQLAHGELQRLEQMIHQSHKALAEAYLETREVIDSLRLSPGEDMILWLEPLSRDFEKNSGMRVERIFPSSVPKIEPEIQAQLLRIVQEALSNVRKHSQASQVRIEVRNWKGMLILEISDNGVGFSAEDVPEFSRHGLRGMRERAELIGADFQVISKPQAGTTIRVHLPLTQEETTV